MRRWSWTLLAVAATLTLTGCSAGNSDELTIYSGRSSDLVGPLLEEFAKTSGIPVAVKYGDSTDLALLIGEEGDRSPADVFFSQSPGTVGYLGEKGLLAPLRDDLTEQVPEAYRSSEDLWVGITARQRVLVYNQELVAENELPQSVLELIQPQYRGKVGVAPSNASFQDFVTAMRQKTGDEATLDWLEGMAANDSPVYANNNAIVEAVGRGEIPLGLVNHYYNERFLAEDPSLPSRNYRFPQGDLGALVIESSASVLAGTDKTEQAQEFIEFLLDRDSQEFFASETFEYPLVSGVDPAGDLPALDELEAPEVDVDERGGGFAETQELIEQSGIAG